MRVAIQMDDISTIDKKTDTSFALCLEAQARGYELYYYTPDSLFMKDSLVFANMYSLFLSDDEEKYYSLGERKTYLLSDMDVILLRQDPPFNMHYITTTYLLEKVGGNTLVLNDPFWVRNSPEKLLVTDFPDLLPPTLITEDLEEIKSFRSEHGDVIVKPLYGNGGAGIFYLKLEDNNINSLFEMFRSLYKEPVIVQKYLPEVVKGDKRIMLIEGEPVGAINRISLSGENRSNLHLGGRAVMTELNERDLEICNRISSTLKERNLFFVGIDVIGGYLTEINVTSPTGVRSFKDLGGVDICKIFWDKAEARFRASTTSFAK